MQNKVKLRKTNKGKLLFIWGGLLIPIINLLIFWVYINFDSFFICFEMSIPGQGTIFTLDNFRYIFSDMASTYSRIIPAFLNTLKFFAWNLLLLMPLCYIFAYFIYKKIFLYNAFRYIFFIPSIVSAVIMTSFLKYMLAPAGPLYELAEAITGEAISFLADSRYAFKVLLFYNFWTGFGVQLIYFYAAFARIPVEVIEYGKLEGLSSFKEMIFVTFPLTWPTYSVFMILSIGSLFSASGPVLLLTQGKVNTEDLSYWSYITITQNSLNGTNIVAALGQLQTLIALPLAIVTRWLSNKVEPIEY